MLNARRRSIAPIRNCSSTGCFRCSTRRPPTAVSPLNRRDRHQGHRRDVPDPRRRQRRDRRRDRQREHRRDGGDRTADRQRRSPSPCSLSAAFGALAAVAGRNRSIADELKAEGYSEGTAGSVQTFFVGGELQPWTTENSPDCFRRHAHSPHARDDPGQNYPGIDLMTTRSRLLDDRLLGPEELTSPCGRARRSRWAGHERRSADPVADPLELERARKLQAFFS